MKNYEYFPHTSDEKFKAYGNSLEEAFENAAYAMIDIITDHKKVESNIEKSFSIESENDEALLYDFLEQFLILVDSEDFLLHKIKEIKIKNKSLDVEFVGDDNLDKYDINTHIKAVTYQEMEIKNEKDIFSVQVIVDI